MKVSVVIAAFAVTFALSTAQDDAQVYCGRRLARTMAFVCENAPMAILMKRSHSRPSLEIENFPWIEESKARSMGRGKRDGGIIEECCYKPCTINELLSYC